MNKLKTLDCALCNGSLPAGQPTHHKGALTPGDIIAAPISVQLFVLNHILRDGDGCTDATRTVLTQARSAFTTPAGWENEANTIMNHLPDEVKKKKRPCLVMEVSNSFDKTEWVTVCPITSLDGEASLDSCAVNEIIRRFAIPLHPFLQEDPNHIHTVPAWKGAIHSGNDVTPENIVTPPAWILARPVRISEVAFTECLTSSLRRWVDTAEDGQQFTYHLADPEHHRLECIINNKNCEWDSIRSQDRHAYAQAVAESYVNSIYIPPSFISPTEASQNWRSSRADSVKTRPIWPKSIKLYNDFVIKQEPETDSEGFTLVRSKKRSKMAAMFGIKKQGKYTRHVSAMH